ncbi:MAG: hypothetical protein HY908_26225 [Myxococcales bacterium]|nr:hypothetical protein [Myxococcales bacterium]
MGQLGLGSTDLSPHPVAQRVPGLDGVVHCGNTDHVCAVLLDGTARCWGANGYGAIGDGTTGADQPTPTPVSGANDVVDIAAGHAFTCARLGDGRVSCWGANTVGQLGNGTTTDSATPVAVMAIDDATTIEAGPLEACVIRADTTLWCWGGFANSTTPVEMPALADVVQVGIGPFHMCVVRGDGTLWCWGDNWGGQLGDGTTVGSSTPKQVPALGPVTMAAVGAAHTCALQIDGTVACWGMNHYCQLGIGVCDSEIHTSPQSVSALPTGVVEIATGGNLTCVRTAEGPIYCWGYNGLGELGNGSLEDSPVPTPVLW